MVPDVAQQLQAIRHMMAKTVIPAIDARESFAQEQAGLIVASLDWLLDTQASQHRYELADHADQRALLAELVAVASYAGDAEARAVLEESATPPADLTELHAQTVRLRRLAEAAFEALGEAGGAGATAAEELLGRYGRRQLEREQALFRMTGFPTQTSRSVAEVLAAQEATAAPESTG